METTYRSDPTTRRHGGALAHPQRVPRYPALERLICAAISNPRLAATLLTEPAVALGPSNHKWGLTAAERELVLSVTGAGDIYDFAGQLHAVAYRAWRRGAAGQSEPIVAPT